MQMETEKEREMFSIPLTSARIDELLEVDHIHSGNRAMRRLSGLGIVPGTKLRIKSEAPFRGPLLVEVRGTVLALGRGISQKIYVKPIGS